MQLRSAQDRPAMALFWDIGVDLRAVRTGEAE
jgi:hypothetical protein